MEMGWPTVRVGSEDKGTDWGRGTVGAGCGRMVCEVMMCGMVKQIMPGKEGWVWKM